MSFTHKVLLVDDDEIANLLHSKTLKKYDFCDQIYTALNGMDALEGLDTYLPNILFLDLKMPKMDGFDFLAEFEKLPEDLTSKISVFILTSSISQVDYQKVNQFKIKGFLNKPLSKDKLEEVKKRI